MDNNVLMKRRNSSSNSEHFIILVLQGAELHCFTCFHTQLFQFVMTKEHGKINVNVFRTSVASAAQGPSCVCGSVSRVLVNCSQRSQPHRCWETEQMPHRG